MIRLPLYFISVYFVLQLDAYLYLLRVVNIAPFLQIIFATALLLIIYVFFKKSRFQLRFYSEAIILLFCFLLYIFVQTIGILSWHSKPNDPTVLVYWLYMLVLLLFGVILGSLVDDGIRSLLFGLLVILVAITVIDTITGNVSLISQSSRSAATLRNPNNASFVMVLLLLGTLRWKQLSFIEVLAIIVAGIGVTLTESRAGMVGYFTIIVFYLFWWSGCGQTQLIRIKRYLVAGFFILTTICVAVLMLYKRRFGMDSIDYEILSSIFDTPARDYAFQKTIELIKEKPLFGHGTGFVYTQALGPHNMFLRAWVENGIPGLLGMLALFLGLSWVGIKRRDNSIILLVIILTMFAMTTHNLTESRSILIISAMLLVNSARKKAVKKTKNGISCNTWSNTKFLM